MEPTIRKPNHSKSEHCNVRISYVFSIRMFGIRAPTVICLKCYVLAELLSIYHAVGDLRPDIAKEKLCDTYTQSLAIFFIKFSHSCSICDLTFQNKIYGTHKKSTVGAQIPNKFVIRMVHSHSVLVPTIQKPNSGLA